MPATICHNRYLNSSSDSVFRLNNSLKTFTKAKNVQSYVSSPLYAFMVHPGTNLRFDSITVFIVSFLKGQGKNRTRTLHDDYQQLVCFVVWPDTNLTMLRGTYCLHLLQWRSRQCLPTKDKWICARLNTVTMYTPKDRILRSQHCEKPKSCSHWTSLRTERCLEHARKIDEIVKWGDS